MNNLLKVPNVKGKGTGLDNLDPLWKILHLVGADWTYGSRCGYPRDPFVDA